jgi:hypothetical protein
MSIENCDCCGEQKDIDFDEGAYNKDSGYLCERCCNNEGYVESKIKSMLQDLHILYNQSVENYEENGEEDFNCWLDMFKESEDKDD